MGGIGGDVGLRAGRKRERARGAMAMIDSGSAKDLPAVVKAAMALPPSAALSLPTGPQADVAPNTAQ